MIFRYLSAICLFCASAWSLVGCGGGTGNGAPGVVPVPPSPAIPSLVQPGVYAATVNGKDFWGVISPAAWGSRWYGLHYAAVNPDIYSGDLSGAGTVSASVSTMRYFQNTSANVLSGSASMKSAGAGQLSGDLNLVTTTPPYKQALSFVASTPTSLNYNQAAQLSEIAGSWKGWLSYGLGSNDAFSISIAASSGVMTLEKEFNNCLWAPSGTTAEPNPEVNLFKLKITMTEKTACSTDINGKTLTGVAFVQKSPVVGQTQRLIWVATTVDGKGMSFTADR